MKLKNLISGLNIKNTIETSLLEQPVSGIAENCLLAKQGDLFIAVAGGQDGLPAIRRAVENGASFVVGELDCIDSPVPYIQVTDSHKALGWIANRFYHYPARGKLMIGITGTAGKTTTSHLLKHIFENSGKSCALIETDKKNANGETDTTLSSLGVHQLLACSKEDVIIMEVSSQALAQRRIEGVAFDFCLFTNLHHAHLDYHGSLGSYFQAKALLFDHLKPHGQAIVCTDTLWGRKLADMLKSKKVNLHQIGKSKENLLQQLAFKTRNSTIELLEKEEMIIISSPLAGTHNMHNTLLAYAAAKESGMDKNSILAALASFEGVSGRFETLKMQNGATVVIDYAHTPDAVLQALTAAKQLGAKRIVHIFGFKGNKDLSKRKDMLFVTSDLSDQYILTLDDLNAVSLPDMLTDMADLNDSYGNEKGLIVSDRTAAIKHALEYSQRDDYIVVTGKGPEIYQQSYELPAASDQETVNYLLNAQLAAKP